MPSPRATRREADVLAALAERLTNAEIAAQLCISERTVESHVTGLLRKFGVASRLDLADIARREQTAATAPRLPGPLELLADPSGFVGRAAERSRLRELWARCTSGQTLVGFVAGEAGIGKSRLTSELATEIVGDGGRVLFGTCFEDATEPYQPFVQAISEDAAGASDLALRQRIGPDATSLAQVVPGLVRRLGPAPTTGALTPVSQQANVMGAVVGYLNRVSAEVPTLVVIEDLHFATATTLATVRHIARTAARARMLMIVTTRNTPPDLHPDLRLLLSDLGRMPAAELFELGGLPEHEVADLLARLGATADPAAVTDESGGNPLLVCEMAREPRGTPGTLYALLARRDALVAEDDLAVLDIAAVIGSEFDARLIALVTHRALDDVLATLERIETAGLVHALPGRPGRCSFTHALFRRCRYDAIAPSRRLNLHRDVAAALADRLDVDEGVLPELARHAAIAAPLGGTRRAVDYSVAAAQRSERSLALAEAATHYRRALGLAQDLDRSERRLVLSLTIKLGEVLNGVGDPTARSLFMQAAAAARATADAHALADIALAMIRYGGIPDPGADPDFVAIVEESLAGMGSAPTALRARTLAALSEDVTYTDPARGLDLVREAVSIAETLADPETLGHVLLSSRFSAKVPGNDDAGHPTADRLIALGNQTGHTPFVLHGLVLRAWTLREEGDLWSADQAMDAAEMLLGDEPAPVYAALFLAYRSSRQLLAGDVIGADQTATEVLALSEFGLNPTLWYGPALVTIRGHQDRFAELLPLIEAGVDQPTFGESYRTALATAYAFTGRLEAASAVVGAFAEDGFRGVRRNLLWLTDMVALAEATERVGDADAAAAIADLLRPFSGRIAAIPATVVSTVDLVLAQMALVAGDVEAAERVATVAVAASRRRHTPLFLGRELIRLAAARRRRGGSNDEVSDLVAEALAISDRTGAALIRTEARIYGLSTG